MTRVPPLDSAPAGVAGNNAAVTRAAVQTMNRRSRACIISPVVDSHVALALTLGTRWMSRQEFEPRETLASQLSHLAVLPPDLPPVSAHTHRLRCTGEGPPTTR